MTRLRTFLMAVLALTGPPLAAHEPGGCDDFAWNVRAELAAMRARATPIFARSDAASSAIWLDLGRHYEVTLLPQDSLRFSAPPGRGARADSPTGGMLFFKSQDAGRYRVSLSSPHWVDVVDAGMAIDSVAHEGRQGCDSLQKVVEFELPANRTLTLQLSGRDATLVSVVITRARD